MRPKLIRKPGPKTPEGKARSSQNALKHGLYSSQALLRDEDPAELEAVRRQVYAELKPKGYLEETHADRVVTAMWRLRRTVKVETANMNKIYAEVYATGENLPEDERRDRALVATYSNRYVDFIRDHAVAFDRNLRRATQDLAYQQTSRRAGGIPIPMGTLRISVDTGRPRGRPKASPEK